MNNRLIFSIYSHRLSTITSANQILCLHEGQVAEAGTHDELLAKNGRYAMMWRKQIRAEQKQKQAAMSSDGDSEDSQEEGGPLIGLIPSNPSKITRDDRSTLESEAATSEDAYSPPPGEVHVMPEIPIPSTENTVGDVPSTIETEATPRILAAETVDNEPTPASPSRKGKSRDYGTPKRSGSSLSTSGGGAPTKWSRGLRKALSLKGTVLHKRSASYGGNASASGSERGADDK